jgi:hypothetical protein
MVQNPASDFIIETLFFSYLQQLLKIKDSFLLLLIMALQFVITCITVYSLLFEKAIQ